MIWTVIYIQFFTWLSFLCLVMVLETLKRRKAVIFICFKSIRISVDGTQVYIGVVLWSCYLWSPSNLCTYKANATSPEKATFPSFVDGKPCASCSCEAVQKSKANNRSQEYSKDHHSQRGKVTENIETMVSLLASVSFCHGLEISLPFSAYYNLRKEYCSSEP